MSYRYIASSRKPTKKVKVYWNSAKKCWSLIDLYGKVIENRNALMMRTIELQVPIGSRDRIHRDGIKNVNAYIMGWTDPVVTHHSIDMTWRRVVYNPYFHDSFVIADTEEPIERAIYACFTTSGKVFIVR